VQAITVNRKVAMVLGAIAAAAALLVFFAGFLTAVGLLAKSSSPAALPSTLQQKLPGGAALQVKPATGEAAVTGVPGAGTIGTKQTTPPPTATAKAGAPSSPATPPPVADDESGAEPAPSPTPRTALPGAVPPRTAGATARAPAPPAAARAPGAAATPPQAAAPASLPARPAAPPATASAGAPTRLVPPAGGAGAAAGGAAGAGTAGAGATSVSSSAGSAAPAGAAGFAIQVGAFLTSSHAIRLADDLQKRGHDARVVVETDTSGRPWHIVRVGRFADRYAALGAANRLKTAEGVPTMVVTEPPAGPALR
jgi:cell division septation protein DedD